MFDPGDYAIAVRWLGRAAEDGQLRTFELDESAPQVVINSTELRLSNIMIELVRVPPVAIGHSRISSSMDIYKRRLVPRPKAWSLC